MRIRVLSRPPLPTIKAWFAVPDSNNNAGPSSLLQHELPISTINDLKFALCSKIHDLTNAAGPAEIKLLLDDFELLDQSPIEVLKDGDLVIIQHSSLRPSSIYSGQSTSSPAPHQARPVAVPNESRKRKRGDNPPPASNKPLIPRSLHRSSPPPISSSSSSSESSTSSSSSSSSSESSSSLSTSSSEDDDSDSSSSSSSPSVYHARHPKRAVVRHTLPEELFTPSTPPVPPGLGKKSTQSRNRRRRVLRAARRESEGVTSNLKPPTSESNETFTASTANVSTAMELSLHPSSTPVPDRASTTDTAPLPPPPSYSLRNKNKRRGFKEAMESVIPTRITFQNGQATEAAPVPRALPSSLPASRTRGESVGPEIGMTTLDYGEPDMDVDDDLEQEPPVVIESLLRAMDPASSSKGKNKATTPRATADLVPPSRQKNLPANIIVTSIDVEADLWGTSQPDRSAEPMEVVVANETQPVISSSAALAGAVSVDWTRVDNDWHSFPPVASVDSLQIGNIVAWQELGLDYTTYSPKMLVILGHILRLPEPSSSSPTVTIRRIVRPVYDDNGEEIVPEDLEAETEEDVVVEQVRHWRMFQHV